MSGESERIDVASHQNGPHQTSAASTATPLEKPKTGFAGRTHTPETIEKMRATFQRRRIRAGKFLPIHSCQRSDLDEDFDGEL